MCHCSVSTSKFDDQDFNWSNKNEHVAKKAYFKVYTFVIVNDKSKLLF